MLTRSIWMAFVGLAVTPVQAAAVCPTNVASGCVISYCDRIESSSPTWAAGIVGGSFSLDLIAGTMEMRSSGCSPHQSCGAGLTATDLYQVVGPASANPIPFEVRVALTGSIAAQLHTYPFHGTLCSGAQVRFVLSSDAASTEFTDVNGSEPCAGKTVAGGLMLPLARVPGEWFPIRYDLTANASGGEGTIRGAVSFANLPPGYSIVSCQGYGAPPVATLPSSWGRLKQVYR